MIDLRERTKIGTDGASLDGSVEKLHDELFNLFYQRNELKDRQEPYYGQKNRISRYYSSREENVFEANDY